MSTTFDRLMEIIKAQHHLDVSGVTPSTGLADAGLDSLAVAELFFSVEEVFGIDLSDLPPEAMPGTVGEVVALIDGKLAAAGGAPAAAGGGGGAS